MNTQPSGNTVTKVNLDKYKPGQLITSMTRRAFLDLWEEIQSGVIQKRWPEGKVAKTQKERTEDMRVRALAMIFESYPNVFKDLLASKEWRRIEVYMGESRTICFKVPLDMTRRVESVKTLRRARRL